ncbi:hypothetical protein [Phreatobacter sp.]|uniref:hypothetical protein n=1 Tax=Phreatobacter sp. TaxID=1966341 RepID=UPI003F71C884
MSEAAVAEPAVTEPAGLKLLVAATPGPLGLWTEQVVRRIVGAIVEKPMETVTLDSDDATDKFLSNPQPGPAILFSRFPRPNLVAYLERIGGGVVLAIDDLPDVIAHHVKSGTLTAAASIRPLSQSLALLAALGKVQRIATIGAAQLSQPAGRLVAELALALGATAGDGPAISRAFKGWTMGSVAESIQSAVLKGVDLEERRAAVSEQDRRTITGAAGSLVDMVLGRQAGDVVWDRSLFFDGTTMTSPAPGIIDMTGPARCLYYGPYLHLPVGVWEGHLYLGCSDQVTDTRLRIDVYSDAVDAVFLTRLTKGGIFRMPMTFTVADARSPLQVRIFIDRGEIDGLFAFKQVVLKRQLAVPAPEASHLIGSQGGTS